MGVREHGLRRIAVVTTGLATASIIGSLALAAIARADTQSAPATGGSATTDSTDSTGSTGSTGSTSNTGPTLSNGNGPAHAKSGGS